MADYYLLQSGGARDGPYSEEDLLDLMDADELGAGAVCEDAATGRHLRVRDLFKVLPPAGDAETQEEKPPSLPPPARTVAAVGHAPFPKAPDASAGTPPEFQRWQPASPAPGPDREQPDGHLSAGRVCFRGHPSLLIYWRSLLLAVVLTAGGWLMDNDETRGLTAGLFAGFMLLIFVFLRRAARRYLITTRHVERQDGLFSVSSREVRLEDIRAIHVTKSGLRGLPGTGTVEFSTAAGGSDDVLFEDVPHAHDLKDLVHRLQDRLG